MYHKKEDWSRLSTAQCCHWMCWCCTWSWWTHYLGMYFKVGIGPASVCTTRKKTRVGYPQLSAVIECWCHTWSWWTHYLSMYYVTLNYELISLCKHNSCCCCHLTFFKIKKSFEEHYHIKWFGSRLGHCQVYKPVSSRLRKFPRPDLGLNIGPFPIQNWAKTSQIVYM